MPASADLASRCRNRDSHIRSWQSNSARTHFKTGAGGPAGPRQARSRSAAQSVIESVLGVRKGDAALGIDQQPIERRADASGYRRRSLGVGVDDVSERIVSAAFEPGPVEIAFDAEHQRVDLPIGADLTTAYETGLVEGVIR